MDLIIMDGDAPIVIEGKAQIEWTVMRLRLSALKLEMAGIKRRRSVYAAIKREYGLRGSKARVYEQFAAMVEAARPV